MTVSWGDGGYDSPELRIAVIGVGNLDYGDDGVGLLVAQLARQRLPIRVNVLEMAGNPLSLLDAWQDDDAVILVDAPQSGSEAGKIHRFDIHEGRLPSYSFSPSTHTLSVAEIIELARALETLPSELLVYGVEGVNFEPYDGLSPEVEQAAQQVVAMIAEEIDSLERRLTNNMR